MQQEFIRDVVARLERSGVTYAITGSMASSIWGTPRTTHDIDIVLVMTAADAGPLIAAFADRYYLSEPAVREAVRTASMFNIIDSAAGLKADLWVTRDDPFNRSMLARRCRLEVVPGQPAWVGTAEDILLHKLVWHTITPSERQLGDAAGIAVVQAGSLDLQYLRDWAERQGTSQLLEEVLQGKHRKQT